MQNSMQIHYSSYSVILNVTATQYTCSLNGVYTPPLTSTVKSSLFTHAHSSPVSLAARLHRCHATCSHYSNSGWTFSGQPWRSSFCICSNGVPAFEAFTSVAFSIELSDHLHSQLQNVFIPTERNPTPLAVTVQFLLPAPASGDY